MWKMFKKYCGDVTIWTYPPPPYVTISHHFRVPPSPLPRWRPFWATPNAICLMTLIAPLEQLELFHFSPAETEFIPKNVMDCWIISGSNWQNSIQNFILFKKANLPRTTRLKMVKNKSYQNFTFFKKKRRGTGWTSRPVD